MRVDYVTWKNFYSVGCPDLDEQHREILRIINDLYAALEAQDEQRVIKGLLDRLVQYAVDHFKHEEELMEEHGYPEVVQHKATHEEMARKTRDLQRHFHTVAGRDLLTFLKQWWINHICRDDQRYRPYMEVSRAR